MSAGTALQAAFVGTLATIGELDGIYDGPPPRAAFPYVAIDAGNEIDWSHKTGRGREVMVALTLWDDQPDRLQRLADLVEDRVGLIGPVTGWQIAGLRFVRRRVVRDVAGPWAAAIDFRVRLLAAD